MGSAEILVSVLPVISVKGVIKARVDRGEIPDSLLNRGVQEAGIAILIGAYDPDVQLIIDTSVSSYDKSYIVVPILD